MTSSGIGQGTATERWPWRWREDTAGHTEGGEGFGHSPVPLPGGALAGRNDVAAACALHPGGPAAETDGIEAEIVTGSLGALRAEAILALPMHDGLIVPRSTAGLTARSILELGERIGHARLGLTVDPAPETGERQVYRAESPHIMEVG